MFGDQDSESCARIRVQALQLRALKVCLASDDYMGRALQKKQAQLGLRHTLSESSPRISPEVARRHLAQYVAR